MKILLKFASGFILAFLVFFGLTSCYNLGHYVSFYYNGRKITSPVIVRDGDTVREPSINMEKEGDVKKFSVIKVGTQVVTPSFNTP